MQPANQDPHFLHNGHTVKPYYATGLTGKFEVHEILNAILEGPIQLFLFKFMSTIFICNTPVAFIRIQYFSKAIPVY